MYTPLYRMNQWHKESYDRIHWAGVGVYLYAKKKKKKGKNHPL